MRWIFTLLILTGWGFASLHWAWGDSRATGGRVCHSLESSFPGFLVSGVVPHPPRWLLRSGMWPKQGGRSVGVRNGIEGNSQGAWPPPDPLAYFALRNWISFYLVIFQYGIPNLPFGGHWTTNVPFHGSGGWKRHCWLGKEDTPQCLLFAKIHLHFSLSFFIPWGENLQTSNLVTCHVPV